MLPSEARADQLAQVKSDPELRRLVRALTLSTRFQFDMLICGFPIFVDAILQDLPRRVSAAREAPVRIVELNPYAGRPNALLPLSYEALIESVLSPLVEPKTENTSHGVIHCINAAYAVPADDEAWKRLFQRMNERRNLITRALGGELILCVSPKLEIFFTQYAPDFWSIRSSVAFLEHKPQPGLPEYFEFTFLHKRLDPFLGIQPIWSEDIKLGDSALEQRQYGQALEAYMREETSVRARLRGEPDHPEWLHQLLWTQHRMTRALMRAGRLEEANLSARNALSSARLLLNRYPELEAQKDTAIGLERLGYVLSMQGQYEASLSYLKESLDIVLKLIERVPGAIWLARLRLNILIEIGSAHLALAEYEQAYSAYDEALSLARELSDETEHHPESREDIAVTLDCMIHFYNLIGDSARAQALLDELLSIQTTMDSGVLHELVAVRLVRMP